jgi:hypothetical protein
MESCPYEKRTSRGNAVLIAQQGRKYSTTFGVNEIIFGDGVNMTGIILPDRVRLQDMRTDAIVHGAGVFVEGEERFLWKRSLALYFVIFTSEGTFRCV